jgi:hypothetical protein
MDVEGNKSHTVDNCVSTEARKEGRKQARKEGRKKKKASELMG